MPNRTVYVREEDLPVWEAAAKNAGEGNLSSYVVESLRQRLGQSSLPDEIRRIEVETLTFTDFGDVRKRRAFQGRWLIHIKEPEEQEWGIAITRKDNFVFYSYPDDVFEVVGSLEELKGRVDEAAYQVALGNLDFVEELDI